MNTKTLQQQTNAVTRKHLAKLTSSILHLQTNGGWVAGQSGSDPNGTGDITNTPDAVTKLVGVFGGLPSLTRQTVLDQLTAAHNSLPTDQKFSRKGKR
jgi:hypothetical protein